MYDFLPELGIIVKIIANTNINNFISSVEFIYDNLI